MAGPRVNAFAGRSAHVNLREAHIHGWRSHMCADVVATMRTQSAVTVSVLWVALAVKGRAERVQRSRSGEANAGCELATASEPAILDGAPTTARVHSCGQNARGVGISKWRHNLHFLDIG